MNKEDLHSKVEKRVLNLIAQITEQPPDSLTRDMTFEGDLSLDSIKLVQMSTSLPDIFAEYDFEDCISELAPQNMPQIQTLGDFMDILERCLKGGGSAADRAEPDERPDMPEAPRSVEIDVVDDQYFFLIAQQAVSTCSLCSRIRFRGEMNPGALKDAWGRLLDRHPILRADFVAPPDAKTLGEYRLRHWENPAVPDIPVRDLRDLDGDAREKVLEEEEIKWKAHEWDCLEWPLHRFLVFRLEDDLFEVFFCNTHVISDGISNQIVVREFAEIYGALIEGRDAGEIAYTSSDYERLVGVINKWEDKSEVEAFDRFLKDQGRDSFIWNPLDSEIRDAWPAVGTVPFRVDEKTTSKLLANTKDWRISIAAFMANAYIATLGKFDDRNKNVILNIPTSGRIYPGVDALGVDAFGMVGCFAQNLALTFDLPGDDEQPAGVLHRIDRTIRDALSAGYDRAQLAKMRSMTGLPLKDGKLRPDLLNLIRSEVKSNVYMSFIGQTGIEKAYGGVEVVDYRAVTTTAANTLDTLVELIHGEIQFTVNFDEAFFTREFIDKFGNELVRQVGILAEASPQPAAIEAEPADDRPGDAEMEAQIQTIGRDILSLPLERADLSKDLEAELGMDSLERIRIVTRIRDILPDMDAQVLMKCRTLMEMVRVIGQAKAPGINDRKTSMDETARMPYHRIIEQCKTRPDDVAILHKSTELTYGELHAQSNRLANYLKQNGIGRGSLVGVLTRRGPQMFTGIFGILKAGGTYVPIDPRYPGGRINYMINHAGMTILLSEEALNPLLDECTKEIESLKTIVAMNDGTPSINRPGVEIVDKATWMSASDEEPEYTSTPDDLMVVLYTSGSTGNPKGVMLNHKGYTNRLEWHQKAFQLEPGERVAQKTSCSFDISVWELFWPLMEGGIMCPIETDVVKNPWALAEWMHETKINVMHFVPSMFGEFINALETDRTFFPDLRWLIYSGEALPVPYIQKWIDKHGMRTGLSNLYGPTEASIDVTYYMIDKRPAEADSRIPIGRPVDNTHILILDKDMNRLPPGEEGELYIAGVQLAKGYLNDPEKTDAAFKPNPFPDIVSEHLYKSGDLSVELPDGNFDYHGRIDGQIKIRGFRVELGEIEAVINSHDAVRESGVLAIDIDLERKRLVAWVSGSITDAGELRGFIGKRLAEYMIPHTFYFLDTLPKTPNGKLDRKALKASLAGETAPETKPSAPVPEPTPVRKPVAAPAPKAHAPSPERLDELPLGPAQKWLVTYFDPPYEWSGSSRFVYHDRLDVRIFDEAVNHLIKNHSAFRTIFVEKNGTLIQKIITPERLFMSEVYDGSHLTPEDRDREVERQIRTGSKFQIDKWPLFKIVIIRISDSSYDITIIGHHLIADMLSNGIMFRNLWQTYGCLLAGKRAPDWASVPDYADLVRLLMDEEAKGALRDHLNYWNARFPSGAAPFNIPHDFQKGENLERSSAMERFTLGKADAKILLGEMKKVHKCNLYTIILAPLYKLLCDWAGDGRVIVSHRMSGRDIGRKPYFFESAGNFAVNFPVMVEINPGMSMETIIAGIKAAFDALPMNGVTYDYISDSLPGHLYPDSKLTPVRANFLGNRTAPASKLFEFRQEDRDRRLALPDQKRTSVLEFFFYINDNEFHLDIDYSENFHAPETIRNLGRQYLESMRQLIHGGKEETPVSFAKPARRIAPPNEPAFAGFEELRGATALVVAHNRVAGDIAAGLAQYGVNIAILGRTESRMNEITGVLENMNANVLPMRADTANTTRVESGMAELMDKFGQLDIVVNSFAMLDAGTLAASDPVEWRTLVETNISGMYNVCRAAIPYMKQSGGGKIINIMDHPSPGHSVSNSARHASVQAVLGMAESLALELKPHNIRVNTVKTDIAGYTSGNGAGILNLVLFLSSRLSDGISGECIKIDIPEKTIAPHGESIAKPEIKVEPVKKAARPEPPLK